MTDEASAQQRLDLLYHTVTVAHEAVYDAYRVLVELGRADQSARDLVAESARISLQEFPSTVGIARELAAQLDEQLVMDPAAAATTGHAFEAALRRLTFDLHRVLARQREIHQALRKRAEE